MTEIRLLLADVDGTLVTKDKVLTPRAIAAVPRPSTTAAPSVERDVAPAAGAPAAPMARGGAPVWIWIVAVLVLVAAAVAFFMLKGRP